MKKLFLAPLAAAFIAASAFAADKEVTLTGAGQCAKCSLKQSDACQNAVVVKEGGKDTTYLMAQNDVAKKFHGTVCKGVKQITVTGSVSEKDGKKIVEFKGAENHYAIAYRKICGIDRYMPVIKRI